MPYLKVRYSNVNISVIIKMENIVDVFLDGENKGETKSLVWWQNGLLKVSHLSRSAVVMVAKSYDLDLRPYQQCHHSTNKILILT